MCSRKRNGTGGRSSRSRTPVVPAGEFANPIDAFVCARTLKENDLKFSPEADARSLVRRATFDLTGLPPTPEAVAAFEKDSEP